MTRIRAASSSGSKRRLLSGLAAGAAALLLLSSCLGGGASSSGTYRAYSEKITQPLIPTSTNLYGGGRIIRLLFASLAYADESGKIINDVAESVESTDNKTWIIKIKPGQKFSNGEPVTSDSFIKAWNYGAKKSNAQGRSDTFRSLLGYKEAKDNDQDLSGLKKIDDRSFTVELKEPNREFRTILVDYGFSPLPEVFWKDPKAFGDNPIGNGPYTLEKWDKGVEVALKKSDSYDGPRKPKNQGISFVVYENPTSAYKDLLSGGLDVQDRFSSADLASVRTDLGARFALKEGSALQMIAIPYGAPGFGNDPEGLLRRKAISMSINRPELVKVIYQDMAAPAQGFLPKDIPGFKADLPGADAMTYNPTEAKKLWEQANAIKPYAGPLKLLYNSNGDWKNYTEAMTHSISNALGVMAEPTPETNFSAMRDSSRKHGYPMRFSWTPDWPAPGAYWPQIFTPGGSGNISEVNNPQLTKLIDDSQTAANEAEAQKYYDQIQELLLKEMPAIPTYVPGVTAGWSSKVTDVKMDWSGEPVYYLVEVK